MTKNDRFDLFTDNLCPLAAQKLALAYVSISMVSLLSLGLLLRLASFSSIRRREISLSGQGYFFGDQDIELIAIISRSLPIFSFDSVVVSLDELLSMKFVGNVHS